jgi:chromosome partitioning protein
MAASVLTIAQQKGGAGKTTLAAHLAVAFAAGGRQVALIDFDPQASLGDWFRLRQGLPQAAGNPGFTAVAGWKAGPEVDRLKRSSDLVIIDSPPHAETEARAAIRSADLVLVPVQPSPMDVWATGPTLELARAARVPVLIVLNRVPPRGRIVEQMRGRLAEDGLAVAATTVGNRISFAASLLEGRTAQETAPRSAAAQEIAALAEEIGGRL